MFKWENIKTDVDIQECLSGNFNKIRQALNCVRLLLQCEQILLEGDLDLRRHREQLKSIRRGEWTEQEIIEWAGEKEKVLEKLYHESTIPYSPDEKKIKELLFLMLESHYGSLDKCVSRDENVYKEALQQIQSICGKVGI